MRTNTAPQKLDPAATGAALDEALKIARNKGISAATVEAAETWALSITSSQYATLQDAYDHLNGKLFNGTLPQVLITLQRHANAYGYFQANAFTARSGDQTAHELALNPDTFGGRQDTAILSTLAHEMCHVWQQTHGRAPRRCYHDKQFATKMKSIGLQPTSTGQLGGKETGEHMTHLVVTGGPFDLAAAEFLQHGTRRLQWNGRAAGPAAKKTKKPGRVKYTCPECDLNAWAKPEARIGCMDCKRVMKAAEPEEGED